MAFAKPSCKFTYTICDDFEEEKDFQTAALDGDHWITDPVPDIHLCIHEHLQWHSLCCYPCPYRESTPESYQDTLDLSDIFRLWGCDDHLQWWRHCYSWWCEWTLKPMDYGLHKNIYITSNWNFVYTSHTFTTICLWHVSCIECHLLDTFIIIHLLMTCLFVFNATTFE